MYVTKQVYLFHLFPGIAAVAEAAVAEAAVAEAAVAEAAVAEAAVAEAAEAAELLVELWRYYQRRSGLTSPPLLVLETAAVETAAVETAAVETAAVETAAVETAAEVLDSGVP